MTNAEWIANVNRIAQSNPVYREGGDGVDGTCDCIGLVMGAMYAGGREEYDMHSTNYFARYEMQTLDSLLDESQLHVGALVYKSRRDTSRLHARYQPGGRYHNGDMLDYYHVGVVTSIDPLRITHCTSSENINGIAYDSTIKSWSHFGDLLDVTVIDPDQPEVIGMIKFVTAASGKSVNVRMRPDKGSPKIFEVPLKESVVVTEEADGWSKIRYNGLSGYMMSQYLVDIEEDEDETVAISKELAEELYQALGQFFN